MARSAAAVLHNAGLCTHTENPEIIYTAAENFSSRVYMCLYMRAGYNAVGAPVVFVKLRVVLQKAYRKFCEPLEPAVQLVHKHLGCSS